MPRLIAPVPVDRRSRRCAQLLVGLFLYGVTASMLVLAGLGLDPWDVLHQGLSRTLGLGIGTWAVLASFVVLLGWGPLRQRPGIGTLANAVVVGVVIDVVLAIVHEPHALWLRGALLVGGGSAMGWRLASTSEPGSAPAPATASAPASPRAGTRCA